MKLDKNVILCGFMGCGKSSAGKALAELAGAEFIDMDSYIETREDMSIPEIFANFGEEGFREREHAAVLALSNMRGTVIASGGGALTFERNVKALKQSGSIVFLDLGFDECYRRIKNTDRPLVRSKTRSELYELYSMRGKLYKDSACFTIVPNGGSDIVAEEILRLLTSC